MMTDEDREAADRTERWLYAGAVTVLVVAALAIGVAWLVR